MSSARTYFWSLASFGAKGAGAFVITFLVANNLTTTEFALWATTFSFGVILSVADLGVGQLVLTTYHEKALLSLGDSRLMANSVAALSALSLLLWVALVVATALYDPVPALKWKELLLAVILIRLVLAPYGAVLSAQSRFHERKVFEAAAYLLSALFVWICIELRAGVSIMVLGMNALITLGSVGVTVRALGTGAARSAWRSVSSVEVVRLIRESSPYFLNNLSGLAIYGGFIAFSSMVLDAGGTARIALLHSLILMHLFQVFEIIFRTAQTRLHERRLMLRLNWLIVGSSVVAVVLAGLVGPGVISLLFAGFQYSPAELAVYTTFAFLEVYYLLLTSAMQMRSDLKGKLRSLSIVKAVAFFFLLGALGGMASPPSLLRYATALVIYSAATVALGLAQAKIWSQHVDRNHLQPLRNLDLE